MVTPRHPAGGILVEDVSIGRRDGAAEYLFSSVAAAVPARDGTVLLLDQGGTLGNSRVSVRQYDSSGRYIRSVGRQGLGPGEFQQPVSIAQLPDGRIAVWSYRAHSLNTFSEQGQFLDVWRIPMTKPYTRSDALVAGHDGNLYVRLGDPSFRPGRRPVAAPRYIRVLGADGMIGDTISTEELPDVSIEHILIVRTLSGGGYSVVTPHFQFSPSTIFAWNPLGFWITGFTNRSSFELRFPPAGTPSGGAGGAVVSVRWNASPVPLALEERRQRQEYYERYINTFPKEYHVGPDDALVPAVKPAWSAVFAGQDGRIWVKVPLPSEPYEPTPAQIEAFGKWGIIRWLDPVAYDLYEPDGTLLGRVRVPGLRILATRGDRVWAVQQDADGVQTVKGFHIEWRFGGQGES
jgi:hypothetical protein